MTDEQAALASFHGSARLFPLPNLVLFPHVDQALHIFEHRYRQMTADALATDRLIAPVLLQPGWDKDYDGAPPIETVACVARIVQHERMIDGRYNLHVRGLARFAIDAEVGDGDKLYRLANGRLLPSAAPANPQVLARLREELRGVVLTRFDPNGLAFAQVAALFASDSPLDRLCDQLGYSLPLALPLKQKLLAEPDAAVRAELMVSTLRLPAAAGRGFPPQFSPN